MSISGPGDVVTDLEDIKQCMYIILATAKGSCPFRPTFGCGIFEYLDMPLSVVAPQIVKSVREAITKWEARIILSDVTCSFGADGTVILRIYWKPVAGTKFGQLYTTQFGIREGLLFLVNEFNEFFTTEWGDLGV